MSVHLGFARRLVVAALSGGLVLASQAATAETYRRHYDHVLGASLDIAVTADDPAVANAADAAIRAEIDRLNAVFNTYDPESEISRLNTVESAAASPELIEVLTLCDTWRLQSSGAMSCRIGALIDAWAAAEEADTAPERPAMRLLAGEIRRASASIDPASGRVAREEPIRLDTNAIAKGYIIDKAFAAARGAAPEARGLLVDIGGDLRTWGEGPDGGGWRVGVAAPERLADNAAPEVVLHLSERAVASSGQGARSRVIAGNAYGHIISPSSGWAVEHVAGATVAAADATSADALATALMVMTLSDGLALAESLMDVEALIVAADGRRFWTEGWAGLGALDESGAGGGSSAWPNGFELSVDFVIPEIEEADYERPYVAIWVGDGDRGLVRVLMLAGEEARWQEENYVWHRRFGRKAGSLVGAVARPTRRPGAYTVVWDGLRDDGSAAGPGDYVLHFEAAREHGGHQYESLELSFGGEPFESDLAMGDELGAVTVRYGAPR